MKNDALQLLEKHFDTAFAAPDGIKKLRELILTLAMQGKLVAQNPKDPPASELLKAIEVEKKRLIKEGKIKKPKPLTEIKPEVVPYELPKEWMWVQLDRLAPMSICDGDWIESKDQDPKGDIRLVQLADIGVGEFKDVSERFINFETFIRLKCTELLQSDILIARLPNPIGRACIFPALPQRAITAVDVAILRPLNFFDSQYLVYAINSPFFRKQVESYGKGATRFRIATGNLKTILTPLPPLPEQHRIVAKIDQLMTRCDELEKLCAEREHMRLSVHTAAIQELLDAEAQDGNTTVWEFLNRHFDDLYTVKENVAELRKAILQLAVMGKIVPQDPCDPPASELLKKIEAEKQRLLKEGKIKKPKPLPEIKPGDIPYKLPHGWKWVRLGELGITQTGTTPPSKNREYYGQYIPFIGPGNIKDGNIDYGGEGLSEIGLSKGRLIEKESVLMVCIGGSIGKHAINEMDVTCNQQINTLTPYIPVLVKYVYWGMATTKFQNAIMSQAGGSATPIINKQKWSSIPLPLPPLSEQHRIVTKIDQLMTLCNILEQQIEAATGKKTELLDAVMGEV